MHTSNQTIMYKRPKANHYFSPSQAENPVMDWFDDDGLRMAKLMLSVMHIQGLGRIHPMIMMFEYGVNWLSADWVKLVNWLRIDVQDYKIRLIGLGLIAWWYFISFLIFWFMVDRRMNVDEIGRMMMIGWVMIRIEVKLIWCERIRRMETWLN